MFRISFLEAVLNIAQAVVQLSTIWLMLRRKTWRQYPVFLSYMVFHIARDIGLYWLAYFHVTGDVRYATYFYTYCSVEPINVTLSFLIIYGAFREMFGPFDALQSFGCALFRIGAAGVLTFAIITTALSPTTAGERVFTAVLLLDRNVALMQAGLLLVLFVGTLYLGLSWRSASLGIALGFGVWACVDLGVMSARAYFGENFTQVGGTLRNVAYIVAVLIWFGYMAVNQREVQVGTALPNANVQRWNESLTELLSR